MGLSQHRKRGIANQYLISLTLVIVTAVICYFSVEFTGYQVVALVLLLVVSVLAMLFDILPVVIAAILSALIWNYFFIPPTFNFSIGTTEDILMFIMYFVIALINTVLTFKIRQFEKKARDKEERGKTIRLYNTMFNSLSHELKTPISTIIGSVSAIKENETRLSDENKKELITEIEVAGNRLNRQVENLLNMSRLESGNLKLKMDWCDLNELIHKVIKNNKKDASQFSIVFEVNENLPLFRTDQLLIEQVLQNILHNALQYTPKNSTIHIDVRQITGGCRFTISDNGPGFPQKSIESVFDKFFRLPQTATGGTGLGLSIAKGFTEALSGTIELENLKTGGAKFTVEIPAETSSINELKYE